MRHLSLLIAFVALITLTPLAPDAHAQSQPDGQLTIAFDVSLAPSFLEPAETAGIGTPYVFLYALHDALAKPLPGNDMAPCLAESWKESTDGLVYEFKLREGLRFHNGDPFSAEDVKFSFQRYRGQRHQDPPRSGEGGRGRRYPPGAVRAARAVARLPVVLRHARHRRRLDRPPEVHREGR